MLQALTSALALAGALSAFAALSAALATPALLGLPPGTSALAFVGLLRLRLPRGGVRGGPLAAEGGSSGSGSGGSGSGAGGSGDSGLLAAVRSIALVVPI